MVCFYMFCALPFYVLVNYFCMHTIFRRSLTILFYSCSGFCGISATPSFVSELCVLSFSLFTCMLMILNTKLSLDHIFILIEFTLNQDASVVGVYLQGINKGKGN